MAASRDLLSSTVNDLATCSICMELFDRPKCLPCYHTFCLRCIEGQCADGQPGDQVPCPLCRQQFQIPALGPGDLRGNFLVQSLVDANRALSQIAASAGDDDDDVSVQCEVCAEVSGQEATAAAAVEVPKSTTFCVNCRQHLCERCSRPHRRMRSGTHRLIPLRSSDDKVDGTAAPDGRGSTSICCGKHPKDAVKLYCFDCEENICLVCSALPEHSSHRRQEIRRVAEDFVGEIDDAVEKILSRADKVRATVAELESMKTGFVDRLAEEGAKVREKGDAVKRTVDARVGELLDELEAVKAETLKDVKVRTDQLQLAVVVLESFTAYCTELKAKAKPHYITGTAKDWHHRATELLQNDVTQSKYCAPTVTFDSLTSEVNGFVGKIRTARYDVPLVVHTFSAETDDGAVGCVTSLDDEIYLLTENENQLQISAYDSTTFVRLCRLPAPQTLLGPVDLASCRVNRCLYIADSVQCCVHRLEPQQPPQQPVGEASCSTNWPVGDKPNRVSVLPQSGRVLVACARSRQLLEFSTRGVLLRRVFLPPDCVSPWHSVRLPSGGDDGRYVVCHSGGSVHRVCLVAAGHCDGDDVSRTLTSFGGPRGSSTGQLNGPFHLAVDRDGFVFVADGLNSRVLLLSPLLDFVRELPVADVSPPPGGGFPRCLSVWSVHLDDAGRRLYVVALDGSGVRIAAGKAFVYQL